MIAFFHPGDLHPVILWGFIIGVLLVFGAACFGLIYAAAKIAKAWGESYEDKNSSVETTSDEVARD
jgi:hypothetical protein